MTKFRHLIWMLVATSGLVLSVSQSQAQLRQPDVGDQPGLLPDESVELDPQFRKTAVLYRTTSYFLERLGITDLAELPDLAPFLPDLEDMDEIDGPLAMTAMTVDDTPEAQTTETVPEGATEPAPA